MEKPKVDAPAKPGADRLPNRPLDRQAAEPEDLDPAQPSNQGDLRLPHEHDEAPEAENKHNASATPPPRQVIEQAASDITRGLRDTERRGVPSDVPAPGPAPEQTPGGEVPQSGIDRKATRLRSDVLATEHDKGKHKTP